MDIIKEFIKPELFIVIPVLNLIGTWIKKSKIIMDNYIPIVLGIIGIVVASIYVLATANITSYKDILMCIFVAITQGILCAGCSVYFNQVFIVQKNK